MALFVDKAHGSVLPAILLHGSVNFVAFVIRYPHYYVNVFFGIAAIIAAAFLPRLLIALEKKSVPLDVGLRVDLP